jgi:phosphatidylglycerol---prolipoprotein diacylglyceryl transferase
MLTAILFPAIDPILISFGPLAIRWYALAYIAGLLGGWFYARRLCTSTSFWPYRMDKRPTPLDIDDLIVWVALGVVLGGRLGYVLFYNFSAYAENPLEALKIWRGGMAFHGGFVGAALAIAFFARNRNLAPLTLCDIAAVVTPIGLFFGRIANFINGELWGRLAPDFAYAVIFSHIGPEPRHASQLYQAFGEGLVLFVLMAVIVCRFGFYRPGLLTGIFLIGYACARIIAETFREPDPQLGFLYGPLTMGMLLSLPMVAVGFWFVLRALRQVRTT